LEVPDAPTLDQQKTTRVLLASKSGDSNLSGRPVALQFAEFARALRFEDLPAAVVHEAKRALLNYFGVAIGGWSDLSCAVLSNMLDGMSGSREASVVGKSARLDVLNACFLNAVLANALEFDDTHMPTVIHPAAPVAPPLFALAERQRISGRQFLAAFVMGVEIACRAGNSVSPGHYARGWHITTTCGVLGSAGASAMILGLTDQQFSHALGIAASQASGLVENLPTGAKSVQMGNSARNGLFAALIAGQGYTAAPKAIEGERGWARAMGDVPDLVKLTGNLGGSWELMKNTYKAYPCGIVLAPVIDACLKIGRDHGLAAPLIDRVVVRGAPLLLARADRPQVPDERIAKLSLQHAAAVAFVRGRAGVTEFSVASVNDADIAPFRSRVVAVADASLSVSEAVVDVEAAGRKLSTHITTPKGSLENPLTDEDIREKARDLAKLVGSAIDIDRLADAVWDLDRCEDARLLMAMTGNA
jgi:2-methylcitrate dehydratase PrpD